MSDDYDILLPHRDPGIQLLPGMTGVPVPLIVPHPAISHVIATTQPAQAIALQRAMISGKKQDLADFCILFPSFPVVVADFSFRGRFPRVGDKILLSGASGRRIRQRILGFDADGAQDARVVAQLTEAVNNPVFNIPVATGKAETLLGLPFLIEAKNFSNFYHFTTETLVYLSLYQKFGLSGEIKIFTKNPEPPGKFVERAIRDFYPELFERITLIQGSIKAKEALVPFNMQHYFSFKRDLNYDVKKTPYTDAPCVEVVYKNMKAISRGSRDSALDLHRVRALSSRLTSTSPKYVYIRRKTGKQRSVSGEDLLLEMLLGLGFTVVSFEDLSPVEQAHLINGVDILVSAHGAGFTNMMYGKADAIFVELSHLQNARHRFGDFHMHAGASGAKHIHFFADHDYESESSVPDIKDTGHLGVRLSEPTIRRLAGLLRSLIHRSDFLSIRQRVEKLLSDGDFASIRTIVGRDHPFLYSLAEIPIAAATAHEACNDFAEAAYFYQIALEVSPFRTHIRHKLVQALTLAGDDEGVRQALAVFRTLAPYWFDRYFGKAASTAGEESGILSSS